MKTVMAMMALAGAAAGASAQTGRIAWQVSKDDGATWAGGLTQVEQGTASVRVRASVSWEGISPYIGFAGMYFDGVVSGAQDGDRVTNPVRGPNLSFMGQTINAQPQGGGVIKIDDSRDTFAPGYSGPGERSIRPSQLITWGTEFAWTNPLTVFLFTFELGNGLGTRSISNAFNTSGIGNERALGVFVTTGMSQRFVPAANITIEPAQVEVVPGPGGLAVVGCGVVMVGARRRR